MLSEKIIEQLVERLVERIEKGNTYVLKKIGESIKKIGTLSPTAAQQLAQVLKYGGSYNEIVSELAKITNLNVKDIYSIFEEVAKKDYRFAKQFYEYRGLDYIPYEQNIALQRQVNALARITANEYVNLSNTMAFAKKVDGKIVYTSLFKAYRDAIDEAVLNVAQGKETFDQQMQKVIKDLGNSGIKTVDYANGKSVRLDSATRQIMQGALRNLHNETQKLIGEEYGADGVEITVHENPAPDHAEVQGKQFSNEQFDNFQNDRTATSYDGIVFPPEFEGHDRRSISQYNCYHWTFSIILGVNKPNYTNEQLKEVIDRNNAGFEIDGKHYTMYEGQQMQRNLETQIRKQKDIQIMAKASGNEELIAESQKNITQLTTKYNELCQVSGLKRKADRLRVSGYRKTKVNYKEPKFDKNDFRDFDVKFPYQELEKIGKDNFDFPINNNVEIYVKQSNKMFENMKINKEYRQHMYKIAKGMEEVKAPIKENIVLYSGLEKNFDLRTSDFVISATPAYQIAHGYAYAMNGKGAVMKIYVEKGAELISTYNVKTKKDHFKYQGELIIPISEIKNIVKIGKDEYLLKKK